MLFKRVLEGKSALSKSVLSADKKCKSNDGQPKTCQENEETNTFQDAMRVLLIAFGLWVLWIGVSYGTTVLPYPFNFIFSAEVMYPPPVYDYPFPSEAMLKKLPPIKEKHINFSLVLATRATDMLQRFEETLSNAGMMVEQATPEHGLIIQGYPTHSSMMVHKWAWTITKASYYLAFNHCIRYGVRADECGTYISTLNLANTEMELMCSVLNEPRCSATRMSSKYRSFDGSCNNVKRGALGKAMTGFKRLLHPKYADGISEPRMKSHDEFTPLPPARSLSASLVSYVDRPDTKHTSALAYWTQFVENDLVHIPIRKMVHTGNTITCCDRSGRDLAPRHKHKDCMPMLVSNNDPFYAKHEVTCLPYVRSVTTFRSDCTFGAAEQMNQASHFLDGSSIYGSNLEVANSLREKAGGLMKTEEKKQEIFPPQVEKAKEKCQVDSDSDSCFRAGDIRVNSHPHLTMLHTMWLREHNRIARELSALNPTWSDNHLYHETRRIVVAQIQHITYNKWLPSVVGTTLNISSDTDDNSYHASVDPTIANAFASAGIRFSHTLLDGFIRLVNEDGTPNATLDLKEHFNKPSLVAETGRMAQLVRGMAAGKSQTMDFCLPDDLSGQLYANKLDLGLDILSIDIQRGRDHGLPPYHQYRGLCHLKHANTFEDFSDSISESGIANLKKWYSHPHDVDLIVGAMAETPVEGGVVGPTFACLLNEQFARTKLGDRYFYSTVDQPELFTQNQLKQIRKASLSKLFCNNIQGLNEIQEDVFSTVSESNPVVQCSKIKGLNLVAWQDALHKPDIITRTKRNVDKWIKLGA